MNTMIRTMVGLGLVALIAGPAAAQGRRGGFGRGGGSLAMLLGNESVQKELKLDDTQIEKAKELAEKIARECARSARACRISSQEERRTKRQEINQEINDSTLKAVGEFLKPEQITRLKQISYQQRGPASLQRPRGRQEAQPDRRPEDRHPGDRPARPCETMRSRQPGSSPGATAKAR